MFHRTHTTRKGLLKQRRPRRKPAPIHHPEWDATVNDLTVHAASPEEILQKKVRHKSKNADAAKRELKARQQGIPVDLMLSPGQVELEMRKLAVLREVLYDHNDLNEVLRRSDKTMHSVKDIFHDSATRKTGHPNVTLAPGKRLAPPVQVHPEQPSKLDALSDSVMDSQALNDDDYSEESEYEDDVQFESKIDCDRFLSLLKDSMNKHPSKQQQERTPEKSEAKQEQLRSALNCTEEVKRTLSRVSSIHGDDTTGDEHQDPKMKQIRKIDQTIVGLAKDTSKLQKKINNSTASTIIASAPQPRANLANCNMTYDDLKGAMSKVQKGIMDLEERKGCPTIDQAPPSDGLAGFTATLIDAVTRLTGYVNEGEIKLQNLEKVVSDVQQKLDHQTALTDALTLELMNSQKQIKQNKQEKENLKKEFDKLKSDNNITKSNDESQLKEKIQQVEKDLGEIKSKLDNIMEEGEKKPGEIVEEDLVLVAQEAQHNKSKDEEELSLKTDMLKLLHALKSKNEQQRSEPMPSASQPLPLPQALLPGATQEAAETIASVESHLRHLKLQHQEAHQRMQELTSQAQAFSKKATSFTNQPQPVIIDSCSSSTDSMSLASLPVKLPASRTTRLQTNFPTYEAPQRDTLIHEVQVDKKSPGCVLPCEESGLESEDGGSFHFLNASESGSTLSVDESMSRSPHVAVQQKAVFSSIQKTQVSLEDRISELNKQHSEAQQRLQNLVARRRNEPTKKVQISVPTAEMLQTPQISKVRPNAPRVQNSAAWYSLSSHTTSA